MKKKTFRLKKVGMWNSAMSSGLSLNVCRLLFTDQILKTCSLVLWSKNSTKYLFKSTQPSWGLEKLGKVFEKLGQIFVLKHGPSSPNQLQEKVIIKMQNIYHLIGRNRVQIFDILITTAQISMGCETQKCLAGNTRLFNLD